MQECAVRPLSTFLMDMADVDLDAFVESFSASIANLANKGRAMAAAVVPIRDPVDESTCFLPS